MGSFPSPGKAKVMVSSPTRDPFMSQSKSRSLAAVPTRPSREEAEKAVRTLLEWAGDDPTREGLRDTPARVARAFEAWFSGYDQDPEEYMRRTFEEVEGYDNMIVLRDMRFEAP